MQLMSMWCARSANSNALFNSPPCAVHRLGFCWLRQDGPPVVEVVSRLQQCCFNLIGAGGAELILVLPQTAAESPTADQNSQIGKSSTQSLALVTAMRQATGRQAGDADHRRVLFPDLCDQLRGKCLDAGDH